MATDEQARAALDAHEQRLAGLANVVGLGVVEADDPGDGSLVAVYVSRKRPRAELAPADIVPATLEIESSGSRVSVATRVIEQGQVSLEGPPHLEEL